MTTTIQILLSSKFDGSGFEKALAKTSEVVKKMKGEFLTGETLEAFADDLFDTGELERFVEEMAQAEIQYRKLAKAATELGDTQFAEELSKQANAAKGLKERFSELGASTRTEIIKNFTEAGQSLDQMSKSLEKASKEQKEYAAEALKIKKAETAEVHLKRARAIDKEKAALDKLNDELNETTELQKKFGKFDDAFKDVKGVKQAQKQLEKLRKEQIKLRDAALSGGNLQDALQASAAAEEIVQLDKAMFGMSGTFKFLGKEADLLGKIVQSKFNQIGFVIFITSNTIKSLVNIVTSLKDGIVALGDTQIFFNALGDGARKAGIDMAVLGTDLRNATQGLISFRDALSGVLELTNAGLGKFAEQADTFARGAVAVELFTGGITQATDAYTAMIDAVRDADASVLDSIPGLDHIPIVLKLAELRAQQFGDELLVFEKRQIIVDSLTESIEDLEDSTKDLVVAGENAREFFAALGDAETGLKLVAATIGADMVKSFGDLETAGLDFARNFSVAMIQLGAQGGVVFAGIVLGAGAMIKQVAERAAELSSLLAAALRVDSDAIDAALLDLKAPSDIFKQYQTDMDAIEAEMFADVERVTKEIDLAFASLIPGSEQTTSTMLGHWQRLFNGIQEAAQTIEFKALFQELDDILGDGTPLEQFSQEVRAAQQDMNDALAEINADLTEKLAELYERRNERLLEITEKANLKIADAEEKLADKIGDINDDLIDKLQDIGEDADDRREDAKKKHARKLEKIEFDHQKKIRDIQRKFELARIKAIIDRDARALFEAQRRRESELEAAQERADTATSSAVDDLQQQLEDIDEAEAKKRERAKEAAEKRRQDAIKAFERMRRDTIRALERQRRDINKAWEKQKKDAKKAADKRRKDTIKAFGQTIKDLQKNLGEQEKQLAASLLRQRLNLIIELGIMTEAGQTAYTQWMTDYMAFIDQHEIESARLNASIDSVNSQTMPPPPGAPGAPGAPDPEPPFPLPDPAPPPSPPDPCDQRVAGIIQADTPCVADPNDIVCDQNGNMWICTPQGWQPAGGGPGRVGGQPPNKRPNKMAGNRFAPGAPGAPGGAPVPVTITVENDKTLEAILEEINYRAFVRIME